MAMLVAIILSLAVTPEYPCNAQTGIHMSAQWSTAAKMVSPDKRWAVEVKPDLSGQNNNSGIWIVSCLSGKRSKVITLTRRAELYWTGKGKELLIINQPLAGKSELVSFTPSNISGLPSINRNPISTAALNETLKEFQKPGYKTGFLQVQIKKLLGANVTMIASGTLNPSSNGELIPFCARTTFSTDRKSQKIEVLTRNAEQLNDECIYFP